MSAAWLFRILKHALNVGERRVYLEALRTALGRLLLDADLGVAEGASRPSTVGGEGPLSGKNYETGSRLQPLTNISKYFGHQYRGGVFTRIRVISVVGKPVVVNDTLNVNSVSVGNPAIH